MSIELLILEFWTHESTDSTLIIWKTTCKLQVLSITSDDKKENKTQ